MEFPGTTPLDEDFKDLALGMALHCVRNTVIENYHANGGISDAEMMVFNKEVVDKLYSFLHLVFNPAYREVSEVAFKKPALFYQPHGWGSPAFDEGFRRAVEFEIGTLKRENLHMRFYEN